MTDDFWIGWWCGGMVGFVVGIIIALAGLLLYDRRVAKSYGDEVDEMDARLERQR